MTLPQAAGVAAAAAAFGAASDLMVLELGCDCIAGVVQGHAAWLSWICCCCFAGQVQPAGWEEGMTL
jgi:hypothetical protein